MLLQLGRQGPARVSRENLPQTQYAVAVWRLLLQCDRASHAPVLTCTPVLQVKRQCAGCGMGGDWALRLSARQDTSWQPLPAAESQEERQAQSRVSLLLYIVGKLLMSSALTIAALRRTHCSLQSAAHVKHGKQMPAGS